MNTLNIEALLSMSNQSALPISASNANVAQGDTGGQNFLSILQSLTTSLGNNSESAQMIKSAQKTPDWLSALMSLLLPNGTPNNLLPTPDSPGEASPPGDLNTSLTDMMAVIQSMLASNGDTPSLMQDLNQVIGDNSKNNDSPTEDILSLMQGLGLAQSPATQIALSSLQAEAGGQTDPTSNRVTTLNAMVQQVLLSPNTAEKAIPAAQTLLQNGANEAQSATPTPQNIAAGLQSIIDTVSLNSTPAAPGTQNTTPAAPATPVAPASIASAPTTQNTAPANANAAFTQALTSATQNGTQSVQNSVSANVPQDATPANTPQNAPAPHTKVDFSTIAAQSNPAQPVSAVGGASAVEAPAAMQNLPDVPALHQIVESVSILKNNGESTVRLNLHPASLGQLLIQLHTQNGEVSIQMLAASTKAQSLIQNHLSQLKASFEAQGLGDNGTFNVNVGSDASAFNTPDRQNARWENLSASDSSPGNLISEESPVVRHATSASNRIDYQI